jgi:hypothetical protein
MPLLTLITNVGGNVPITLYVVVFATIKAGRDEVECPKYNNTIDDITLISHDSFLLIVKSSCVTLLSITPRIKCYTPTTVPLYIYQSLHVLPLSTENLI